MHPFRLLVTTLTAALVGPAVLLSAAPPASAAPAATAGGIAVLATANLGKKACSVNSRHGRAFFSSCTGNGGRPEYWCADFARWVWSRAGVADTSQLNALAGSFYTYGERYGTLSSEPAVGDAAVFNYAGGEDAEHVALVTGVNLSGSVTTVSGDWGGTGDTEAKFASTSTVALNAPAYLGALGTSPPVMGMTLSAFVAPVGVGVAPVLGESLLAAGATLTSSERLTSPNGLYALDMQADGNLVESIGSRALWSTATKGSGNQAIIQSDGDLVVDSSTGRTLWSSRTGGHSGHVSLAMRDDGSLVINGPSGALWRMRPRTGTLIGGQMLLGGQGLASSNGMYALKMQRDGNLVEYTAGRPIWWTGTEGEGYRAIMQLDGNLVIYSPTGSARWSAHSGGRSGRFSLVLMNGASLLINDGVRPVWTNHA